VQAIKVNVRVIAATNKDLEASVKEGAFREDLYYRLNVIELQVPPLAERRDDVLLLARHFLEPGRELSAEAERALMRHDWPGNVRELANCVRRACLLAPQAVIRAQDLVLPVPAGNATEAAAREPERDEIEWALQRADGVVARAARELGLSRQSLYRRMERLGIESSDREGR
jgi:DNA-binding NtrC family response regulator